MRENFKGKLRHLKCNFNFKIRINFDIKIFEIKKKLVWHKILNLNN